MIKPAYIRREKHLYKLEENGQYVLIEKHPSVSKAREAVRQLKASPGTVWRYSSLVEKYGKETVNGWLYPPREKQVKTLKLGPRDEFLGRELVDAQTQQTGATAP